MVPTLHTERLILRAPIKDDLERIYRLGSDPEVMRYINGGKTMNRAEAQKDLDKRISASQGNLGYWITLEKGSGEFIGWTTLKSFPDTGDYEVGYRLLREKWGKGYATEASQRLIEYGFKELKIHKIIAVAMPENKASRRVMEKLGLAYIGTGTYYKTSCVIYAIEKEEFREY